MSNNEAVLCMTCCVLAINYSCAIVCLTLVLQTKILTVYTHGFSIHAYTFRCMVST